MSAPNIQLTDPNKTKAQPFIVQGSERLGITGTVQAIYFPGDQATQTGACYQAEAVHLELIERAAEEGFKHFRTTSPEERAGILTRLADLIEKHQKRLSELITEESGKPIMLSVSEVERSIRLCRAYAAEASRMTGLLMSVDNRRAQVQQFPVGPVLAITPYNFPLNLVIHKLAPAIAAGCSITIKPAPQTPLTALFLGRLTIEAGYEAISIVPMSNELAERLARSEVFRKLSFTGSAAVGWKLRSLAGSKSVTLELGGNAAVVVEELSEPVSDMTHRIAFGSFAHAGQICVSVQRIFINEKIKDTFMASFVAAARAMKVGDPFKYDTEVGPMISIDAVQGARGIIKDALRAGANVVYGGNTYNVFTMNPTILDRTTFDMAVNTEEVFAPIVTIHTYQNFEEALALVNQSKYGLQAGVYTTNPKQIEQAYQTLDVGGVVINDVPTYRSDVLPYGGVKASGIGREGVMSGISEYSYTKTLVQP
jgi:acyl-CoA reductase-like NAD-dependent aldehyde dehydrogenase